MAERVPAWLERLVLPRLDALMAELKAFRAEVAGEFKALHEMLAEFRGGTVRQLKPSGSDEGRSYEASEELEVLHAEVRRLDERIDGLENQLDLVQRLAAVETKLHEYEKRRTRST